ncbi:MAG: winged helix-turn-helix transcriptional regulator [Candidatus Bathyarchaeota archaeon]|nr:MAG: winged helix-turn-helix transcriptional regulator [Candidatus Bathyarchaeota archaeon]
MKNSKVSDRKLAKITGVSQPTITRRRAKLEKDGMLDYTAIPNFVKLGFEIFVISFYSWKAEAHAQEFGEDKEKLLDKLSAFLSKNKNILFTSRGRGFGMQRMMISVHKSYSDYMKLVQAVNLEYGTYLSKSDSFIISLKTDVVGRTLGFKYLAEYIVENLKKT